jgi:hypothetical protein
MPEISGWRYCVEVTVGGFLGTGQTHHGGHWRVLHQMLHLPVVPIETPIKLRLNGCLAIWNNYVDDLVPQYVTTDRILADDSPIGTR